MKPRTWYEFLFPWLLARRPRDPDVADFDAIVRPLREFVYLDESSVKSLLASQQGTLRTETTEQSVLVDQAELTSRLSVAPKGIGAELGSRYQSTSTLGSQTLRKTIAQSQFKELIELDDIAIRFREGSDHRVPADVLDLLDGSGTHARLHEEILRGDLIEVEVELTADPIYRFSATMSELSDLAEQYPEMTNAPGAAEALRQMGPVNRALQQLLVNLVPIRARATSLVAIEHEGRSYIARASSVESLGLTSRPIDVVGVTDLSQYWKDVRRVLFSSASFTMLCRISRDGLQDSWTAVKGAEVLSEIMPTFPEMLEAVGRIEYDTPTDGRESVLRERLDVARMAVARMVAERAGVPFTPAAEGEFGGLIASQVVDATSPSSQRLALDRMLEAAAEKYDWPLSSEDRMELRRIARKDADLPWLVSDLPNSAPTRHRPVGDERLLDVEVIAIYW